ncbi:hypothetical protein F4804DRAFT_320413 [Jackrogersella minutella]|nr:hypothetical protein F4804DRAFT_320413 [Jackrogersella minutella]
MGARPRHDFLSQEMTITDHFSTSVEGAINFANHVQGSLDDIKGNTKRLFWWTSTLVCICLGLFLLAQLVRLRHEMNTLVQYSALFKRMWEEDKEFEFDRVEEKRRERLEERRRAARSRGGPSSSGRGRGRVMPSAQDRLANEGGPYTSTYQPAGRMEPSPFGPQLDAALDSAPPPGPQRDEWVRRLASMTQGLRRDHREQQQGEDEGEDEEAVARQWG